ncbi:MAG: ketoacyl-ACP synthase III [Candidatus Aureabacteria bacterium]|nr:ketoacyl-ACP synthase III [Candidatus Auribacterota bacterium]
MSEKAVGIIGIGSYLPERVLTNADLERMVDTSDEWIVERTGINTRHIAAKDQPVSALALEASRAALGKASFSPSALELLIVATVTGDMPFPSTACVLQEKLGAFNAACFDLNAACSGWIYGMDVAWQLVRCGRYRNALVVGAEKLSAITDWQDRNTCVLFGDGAGAALLGHTSSGGEIIASCLGADGRWGKLLYMRGGGSLCPASHETVDQRLHYIKMEGKEVFKQAVTAMAGAAEAVLEKAGMRAEQISCVIPHQANMRIIKAVARKLAIPFEKMCVTVDHCGNLSAASIPVALDEAMRGGRVRAGDYVLLVAFGGGFTWGAMIVKM